ncbi:MAG: hypothetical protein IH988_02545 [Planctomycetes bacterium]|nr:hypothetical protein [Planctomycetota bacterium]
MMTTLSHILLTAVLTVVGVTPPPEKSVGTYIGSGSNGASLRLQLLGGGRFVYSRLWPASRTRIGQSPSRNGTALEQWHGIDPRRYRGTWTHDGEAIVLAPVYDPTREDFPNLPVRWFLVRWDVRTYLVPEGKLIVLCNAYNLGTEPRADPIGDPFLLLRDNAWTQPATGRPAIPEVWRSFLLDNPISGKLIRIDEDGFGYLDIGGDHGLQAGMQLVAYDSACPDKNDATCLRTGRLKVVCPCDDSARIEFVYPGVPVSSPPQVAIGDVVSTTLRRAPTTKANGQDAPN